MKKLILSVAAGAIAIPGSAAPVRAVSAEVLYVRARAAEGAGDVRAASAGFAALMARDPGNMVVAQRAYGQAVGAGDFTLALRAANLLDRAGALRPDGRLLLALDAVRARNWAVARAEVAGVERDRLFAFLSPMLQAWIAQGSGKGDPLALIEPARASDLGKAYFVEQRALLLIATGHVEEGVAALRGGNPAGIAARPLGLRLIAADALARAGQRERAIGLLDGGLPTLAVARARIAARRRLQPPLTASSGVAELLTRVAADFSQQRLVPVGLTLARFATYLSPDDAGTWMMTADLLVTARQPEAALAALEQVPADDPLTPAKRAVRVGILNQMGNHDAARADALADAKAPEAGPVSWARVGDVYLAMARPADAAAAYTKAIMGAEAQNASADTLWPLWLQRGGALESAGDWPGARAALTKAMELSPNEALVLNQLGYSQIAHRENVDDASALIERASKLRPDDAAITDSLGWVYFLRGQPGAAVPLLEKAAAADPAEPTINEHLGDAYWTQGRQYEARYAWRAAMITAEDKDHARIQAKVDLGLTPATAAP